MKKFLSVLIAAVMAIFFSAFTPGKKAVIGLHYYDGTWHPYNEGEECEPGVQIDCLVPAPGGGTMFLYFQDSGTPDPTKRLKYNDQAH